MPPGTPTDRFEFSFTPVFAGQYVVTLTATDDDLGTDTITEVITVRPGTRTVVITDVPASAVGEGDPVTLGSTVGGTGLSPAITFNYAWSVTKNASPFASQSGLSPTFRFTPDDDGTCAVTLTITGSDSSTATATATVTATNVAGLTSDEATLAVSVWAIQADPLNPPDTVLVIGGSTGDDTIKVNPTDDPDLLRVKINEQDHDIRFRFQVGDPDLARLAIFAQSGDDKVTVSEDLCIPAWLYGGAGDDSLKGGSGDDVLLGGAGNDLLVGQEGRDLLIGGVGEDKIVGNADDDIMVAGWTVHESNDVALHLIMAAWTSNRSYTERVNNLIDGSGSATRANGGVFLQANGPLATVFDDNARDVLTGDSGHDWFLLNTGGENESTRDKATDLSSNEFAADLDFIECED